MNRRGFFRSLVAGVGAAVAVVATAPRTTKFAGHRCRRVLRRNTIRWVPKIEPESVTPIYSILNGNLYLLGGIGPRGM